MRYFEFLKCMQVCVGGKGEGEGGGKGEEEGAGVYYMAQRRHRSTSRHRESKTHRKTDNQHASPLNRRTKRQPSRDRQRQTDSEGGRLAAALSNQWPGGALSDRCLQVFGRLINRLTCLRTHLSISRCIDNRSDASSLSPAVNYLFNSY